MGLLNLKNSLPSDLLSVHIKGERVALVPISRDYSEDIFKEFTAEITRYMMPKPLDNIEQVNSYIDSSREKIDSGDELILAITTIENGEFLGVCGLHGRELSDAPELGVWIKKSAHGKGLGREAIHTLAAWAQEHVNFTYLIYPVDKNNMPSRKVAESLGGVVFKEGRQRSMSGKVLEEVVYKIKMV